VWSAEGDLLAARDSGRGSVEYEVNADHMLIAERWSDGAHVRYDRDAAGNLTYRPGLKYLDYGPGNLLRQVDDEWWFYDLLDGTLCLRKRGAHSTSYEHDALGRLIAVTWTDGRPTWTCRYDALGRRVQSGCGDDKQTTFVWDGDRVAAEKWPDGRVRVYVYAGHDALVPVGFVDDTSATGGGLAAYTVHSDAMGHPRIIFDSHGDMVWRCTLLDAYGKLGVEDKHTLRYAARWPGHWWDADIELQYNRFRWYDPRVGRYIESDPLGTAGGVNLYAYVDNPTRAVDLLGLNGGKPCGGSTTPGTPPTLGPEPVSEAVTKPRDPSQNSLIPSVGAEPRLFENKFPEHQVVTPLQIYTPSQLLTKAGRINYVVMEDGSLRLGRQNKNPGGGHIDLAGGDPVVAAGELTVVQGKILHVDNTSGHYMPSGAGAQAEAERAFRRAGFDISGKYIEKFHDGVRWVRR
jgi:RHS repeat-associated protein